MTRFAFTRRLDPSMTAPNATVIGGSSTQCAAVNTARGATSVPVQYTLSPLTNPTTSASLDSPAFVSAAALRPTTSMATAKKEHRADGSEDPGERRADVA